jgi:hypothetical protein
MLLTAALVSGCFGAGREAAIEERRQVCAGWKPILVHPADRLTEGTARQIEAHNLFGEGEGCWTRRGTR